MTSLLASLFSKHPFADHSTIEFVPVPNNLLSTLTMALRTGRAIGIYSERLGAGMFVTGVEAISVEGKEPMIELKRYDVMGTPLACSSISLSQIKAICPFEMQYRTVLEAVR